MVQLFDKQTGAELGTITDDQLQFPADHLEEETREDDDYYLNRTTVDFLEAEGAEPEVISILRQLLAEREEAEIRWERS
jgi:hypothetical protein